MNGKYLAGMLAEAVVKIFIVAVAVILVYRGAATAYDFGYKVFADEPVSQTGGRTITVSITEDQSVKDIGDMLEEKGIIKDARLFYVQELLFAYHGEITPGIYDLSTTMKAEEILKTISPQAADSEDVQRNEDMVTDTESTDTATDETVTTAEGTDDNQ